MSLLEAIQRAHDAEKKSDELLPKDYNYDSPEWYAWHDHQDELKSAQEQLRAALADAIRGPR